MASLEESAMESFLGGGDSETENEHPEVLVVPVEFEEEPSYREGAHEAYKYFLEVFEQIEDYSLVFDGSLEDVDLKFLEPVDSPQAVDSLFSNFEGLIKEDKRAFFRRRWVFIGGNHSVSFYIVKNLKRLYGNLGVLVFDGHLDLYKSYMGSFRNHACSSYRMGQVVGFENLAVVGVKTASEEELRMAKSLAFWDSHHRSLFSRGRRVFGNKFLHLSVDMDVFSPAVAPAVANPEPGGWSYETFLEAIKAVAHFNVVSFDLVEYLPSVDITRSTAFLFATIFREIIIALWGRR